MFLMIYCGYVNNFFAFFLYISLSTYVFQLYTYFVDFL